jgi:hypothetical protein
MVRPQPFAGDAAEEAGHDVHRARWPQHSRDLVQPPTLP